MATFLAQSGSSLVARPASRITAKSALPHLSGRVAQRRVPLQRLAAQSEYDAEVLTAKAKDALADLTATAKSTWDKTEDKPAAIILTLAALVGLSVASSVVDTVDRIPIIGDLVELIGIGVTGWFVYRYLIFGPDRQELVANIKAFLSKVDGSDKA